MKNSKGFIGLAAFVLSLWALVVVTYAKQAGSGVKLDQLRPLQQSSCSSSSSSSSSGE